MKIISVSIDEETEREIDSIMKEIGATGRSETVRNGIKMLGNETQMLKNLQEKASGILVVIHKSGAESMVSIIKHKYEDVISTQIHNNLKDGKCLEVFILNGSGERIKNMVKEFMSKKKISYTKLIVT